MGNPSMLAAYVLLAVAFLPRAHAVYSKKYSDAGLYLDKYYCQLDSQITAENFRSMQSLILDTWQDTCSENRGVFVLDPPDGQTYNCGKWPDAWNATIDNLFEIPPDIARNAFDQFIQAVYNTSLYQEPDCDFGGLAEFKCGREQPWKTAPWFDQLQAPIRAVNIGGLFVLERWIVPDLLPWGNESGIVDQYTFSEKCADLGICDIVVDHWSNFYNQTDFYQMKELGLNAIRFPVGHWYFTELSGFPSDPYLIPSQSILDVDHPITKIISYAKNAGISVIIDLHTAPGSQNGFDNSGQATNITQTDNWGQTWIYNPTNVDGTVSTCAAIAKYINFIEKHFGLDNVMMFEILNEPWEDIDLGLVKDFYVDAIARVREVSPSLPILLHDSFRGLDWGNIMKDWPFDDVFLDTHSYQCFNPWDLASDSPKSDRNKIYSHEMESCADKIPFHYETCNAVPIMIGEFSLAVDDCMPFLNARYEDVGQCDHLQLRIGSKYWEEHTKSFAMRQIATFERELGWSFWTWKLSDWAEEKNAPSSWYWSFRLASQKGFIDLHNKTLLSDICLYPPLDDYLVGGNGVNGTDDGGQDDITMHREEKAYTYSTIPPGTTGDEPLQANHGGPVITIGFSMEQTIMIAIVSFLLGASFPTLLYINQKRKEPMKLMMMSSAASENEPFRKLSTSYISVSGEDAL